MTNFILCEFHFNKQQQQQQKACVGLGQSNKVEMERSKGRVWEAAQEKWPVLWR